MIPMLEEMNSTWHPPHTSQFSLSLSLSLSLSYLHFSIFPSLSLHYVCACLQACQCCSSVSVVLLFCPPANSYLTHLPSLRVPSSYLLFLLFLPPSYPQAFSRSLITPSSLFPLCFNATATAGSAPCGCCKYYTIAVGLD